MLAVQVQYAKVLEDQRHNQEVEAYNKSSLQEVVRHNMQSELFNTNSLLETRRHNIVSEKQQDKQIAINQGHLNLGYDSLAETARHNLATEQSALIQAQAAQAQASAALRNAKTNAERAVYQNSLDAATESLRNVQALESHAKREFSNKQKQLIESQKEYQDLQNKSYDAQLLMRAVQMGSGMVMPFMVK